MALLSNLTALLSCLEPLFITKQMQSFNYRNVAGLDNKEEYFFPVEIFLYPDKNSSI